MISEKWAPEQLQWYNYTDVLPYPSIGKIHISEYLP